MQGAEWCVVESDKYDWIAHQLDRQQPDAPVLTTIPTQAFNMHRTNDT